jgi:CheY-like chemotaxis protein
MLDPVAPCPLPCERVLIVDPDLDALESLGDILSLEGVSVVHGATSVEEAEGLLARGFRPSAVVLDLRLHGQRGTHFARRLKADPATCRVPVIAVSADSGAIREARDLVERTFLKPASPAEVLTALREVCCPEAPRRPSAHD